VSSDFRTPYWVTGAQQDSGAVAVRSRGKFAGISMRDWEPIGAGGESGMTAGDPLHPGIIFGGTGARWDLEANGGAGRSGGQAMPACAANLPPTACTPLPPGAPANTPRNELARTDWTQPLVFSKADPHALYYANQYLFKSTDDSQTWTRISGDLTRPDPGVPSNLDEVAANDTDRNGKRGVIYSIAPSPVLIPMVWIGTDDGVIQVTTDDGQTWQNVTPPAVTAWSRVTTIEASHTNMNEAYASVDRHQLNDFNPHIFRTRDQGKTWQEITRGLPAGVYVHVVKEDPEQPGLLFAGTERNVWVSFNDGDNWQPLQLNLPVTSNRDFEIHGNDLIVATHGRGFWVIDDISSLRQVSDASKATGNAYLFKPSAAEILAQGGDNGTPTQHDEPWAQNPPSGAAIDFYLKQTATTPVSIEVIDTAGQVVGDCTIEPNTPPATPSQDAAFPPNTTLLWRESPERLTSSAGMHRWVWNPGGGGGRGGGGGPVCGAGAGGRGGRGGAAGGGGGRGGRGGGGAAAGAPPAGAAGATGSIGTVTAIQLPAGGRGAGGGGRGGGGAAPLTGTFTVRLTVGGETHEQTLVVKR
jgi:hypothetical protein